jgi:Ca-activated chloride channel family protein
MRHADRVTKLFIRFSVGALYARRPLSNEAGVPLWLKKYDVDVKITDQIAVTHVDQTFQNETNTRLEGIFVFPLPDNAVVTELALWINGQRVVAKVMDSDTARATYDNIVRRSIDPALMEYLGKNIFKLSVFPIDPTGSVMSERRIEITYAELLPYDAARVEYKFFMKTVNMSSKPVQRASLALDLTTQNKVISFTSPSHPAAGEGSITKVSDNHYTATFGDENTNSEKDLRLIYTLEQTIFAMNHLTYAVRPDSLLFFDTLGDNPYFLLWVTPSDTAKPIDKNVVLVADVSSSMTGARIIQLRAALNAMVDKLNTGDFFNIIAFNTSVKLFKTDIVIANTANKAAAHAFINSLSEASLTNIEGALKAALQSSWDPKKVNAIVFLTDGKPTWPITSTSATILDTVRGYNTGKVELYTFGIGDGVETDFLKLLAKQNDGFATMILADDKINTMMQSFMTKISYPLLKNLAINYSGISAYDIFPNPLPNLYAGAQLSVLGRYRIGGEFPITVTGSRGQDSLTLSQTLAFPALKNHPFVPRMWASSKIDFLLNEIAIYGENPELVSGVKTLGKKYSIITKYTSAIVVEPTAANNMLDKTVSPSRSLKLFQNLPNPFAATTQIRYSIPAQKSPQFMSIKIYDASGKLVRTLVNEMTAGGNYVVHWNATDQSGRNLCAGIYFAVLEIGQARQMITMRHVR